MDWSHYQDAEGNIDILQALEDRNKAKPLQDFHIGHSIILNITSLHSIKSTELATTIFILAIQFSVGEE